MSFRPPWDGAPPKAEATGTPKKCGCGATMEEAEAPPGIFRYRCRVCGWWISYNLGTHGVEQK